MTFWRIANSAGALALASMLAAAAPPAAAPRAPAPARPATPAAPLQPVDLALVLAVDVSGSIDYEEAELQRRGIAEAFMSKDVVQAIQQGSLGRIAVSVVFFSSVDYGFVSVPVNWTVIRDEPSSQAFVRSFLAAPRGSARGTSISDALEYADRLFESAPFRAQKRTIDVSGDGPNNAGGPVLDIRSRILAKGITINALPIVDDSSLSDLDKYFQGCVIGGPGSFVLVARGFADFARAMRRKLVLEISGLTPDELPGDTPRLVKAAAAPRPAPVPTPPAARPAPQAAYPGGCDFPMFGGGFGFR
jgi:hypothetical protein